MKCRDPSCATWGAEGCCATMCVMRPKVGVRELRQNLSVYLRRVLAGESFDVTDRGQRVAILGPQEDAATPLMRLRREGKVIPAIGDLFDLDPPSGEPDRSLSEALEEQREERL